MIGRITGGSRSWIDGTISCTIPGADLFLINPSGLIFGPNATLDTTGSFHASSADFLRLGNDVRFDARPPVNGKLTSAAPSAFGFLTDHPASISVQGSYLKVSDRKSLSLVGGNISLDSATLSASSGRINIAAVASSCDVIFNGPGLDTGSFANLGSVSVSNSSIDAKGSDVGQTAGGSIFIRSGGLTLNKSTVNLDSYSPADNSGKIDIAASGVANFSGQSSVHADAYGAGRGADISMDFRSLAMNEGSWVSTNSHGTGMGGKISLKVDGLVTLSGVNNACGFFSGTYGQGDGGEIVLNVGSLLARDGGMIESEAFLGSYGKSGRVDINAKGSVSLLGFGGATGNICNSGISSLSKGRWRCGSRLHFREFPRCRQWRCN